MEKKDLLQLEQLSSLKPADLEKQAPSLYKNIVSTTITNLQYKLTEQLKSAPDEIKKGFEKLDVLNPQLIKSDFIKKISENKFSKPLTETQKNELVEIVSNLPTVEDLLIPDLPIFLNPIFQQDLQKAKLYKLNQLIGLDDQKVEKISSNDWSIDNIDQDLLTNMVKEKIITTQESDQFTKTASLNNLLDNNFNLLLVVNQQNNINDLSELVKFDQNTWIKWIQAAKIELPDDTTTDDYANYLMKKVEFLFPEETLQHKLSAYENIPIAQHLKVLADLNKENELFGFQSFENLDLTKYNDNQLKLFKDSYDQIDRLVKLYPGLELDKILNDKNPDLSIIDKNVFDRINILKKFYHQNNTINYLNLTYKHDSEDIQLLNFVGFSAKDKNMILQNIKSQQRIFSFTKDISLTEKIMSAGYHSAYQIVSVTQDKFLRDTKLELNIGSKLFQEAHLSVVRAGGVLGTIIDQLTGSFDWTNVGNTGSSINDYLKDIPGYHELFGEMAFCDCSHCQSIYSPAAYFVDLMQFIDKNITTPHFAGDKSSHVLNLKNRRNDLWTLELNCENTSTLVPYLEIINEILEIYIAKQKGFTGNLTDKNAVENFIYKDIIAQEVNPNWRNQIFSINSNLYLPIKLVSTYLHHFDTNRGNIAAFLNESPKVIAQSKLNISNKEFELITTADLNQSFINKIFGINFILSGTSIKPLNAQLFLKSLNCDRKQLERIFSTRYVNDYTATAVLIKSEKSSAQSLQKDLENVHGLTMDRLDKIHRFVRFLHISSLEIEALDELLFTLKSTTIATDLNENAIVHISKWMDLKEKLNVSFDELISLIYLIPQSVSPVQKISFFDKLFNQKNFINNNETFPLNTTKYIHSSFQIDKTSSNAIFSSARMMAALQRNDAEIAHLIQQLAIPLGVIDLLSTNEDDRGFLITKENLSLLYRHSLLANKLKLTVVDLFKLIKLIPSIPNDYIENDDQCIELIKISEWFKTCGYKFEDLDFIINGEISFSSLNNLPANDIVHDIIGYTTDQHLFYFVDTVFSTIDGISESDSRAIIAANLSRLEFNSGNSSYKLKPDFDLNTPLIIPSSILIPELIIRSVIYSYHPLYFLPNLFASKINLPNQIIEKIIELSGFDLSSLNIQQELTAIVNPPNELNQLVKLLQKWSVLNNNRSVNENVLSFILNNLSFFNISDINDLDITAIQKISNYLKLINLTNENHFELEDLNTVISSYNSTNKFSLTPFEQISNVLKVPKELILEVHELASHLNDPISALFFYKDIIEQSLHIGISPKDFKKIVSTNYDVLNESAAAIQSAFISKYQEETERIEKIEKYQDIIREEKRNALTNFMIHGNFAHFVSVNDLYHYFLIDTELGGCTRTSRLVAATMSLQLYVHRVLLNLEQDDQIPGTVGRISVQLADSFAEEWEWRKNYRVWEANRKIFLYPENYIEPDLRDDKSPLFKELEKELLQKEIDSDAVLDAYSKYMRGFDEIAHLKIAGTYHEKDTQSETDVLHLFGVTAEDPCTYYYRKVENIHYSEINDDRGIYWGVWEKVNVQIPVRKVSPIIFNGRLYLFWVKITTTSSTTFDSNKSYLTGYTHRLSIEFTTLKLDGNWSSPQKLNLSDCYPFDGNGIIRDPLIDQYEFLDVDGSGRSIQDILTSFPFGNISGLVESLRKLKIPRYDTVQHNEANEDYTLHGPLWDRIYPAEDENGRLILTGAAYQLRAAVDFYNLDIIKIGTQSPAFRNNSAVKVTTQTMLNKPGKILQKRGHYIYRANSPTNQYFDNYAYGSLLVNTDKSNPILNRFWSPPLLNNAFDNLNLSQIAVFESLKADVQIVNGSFSDMILDINGDLTLLQGSPFEGNEFVLRRIGTTLSETLTRTLFSNGVEHTLSIQTQKALKELKDPFYNLNGVVQNKVVKDKLDWKGAYGNYYKEIFFHIPFLLANHLNSQGKYADAQKWYHYIFNPSSTEVISFPSTATDAQRLKLSLDRNWQYIEFRELSAQTLRAQLNDKTAIEAYKKDPFNPHAIARLRISAYQKSIVMKYIDNLLDWGDQLFTQDTMESINEASLLYIMAKEILGKKPAQIGDCGESNTNPKNYNTIQPKLSKSSTFFAELESYTLVKDSPKKIKKGKNKFLTNFENLSIGQRVIATNKNAEKGLSILVKGITAEQYKNITNYQSITNGTIVNKAVDHAVSGAFAKGVFKSNEWKKHSIYKDHKIRAASFGWSFVHQLSPVFCIPGNKDLLTYYDRVDDRLFKIRNCMNIDGLKRQLALFAHEIDPRLLVRATAAGLSLDDILNYSEGNLPPYRFTYILERAKAFTSLVQNFGNSFLNALEKKNAEELSSLKMTQQQNLLELSTKSKLLEIKSAEENIKVAQERIQSLEYQINYYKGLIDEKRNLLEYAQSIAKHQATGFSISESIINTLSAISALVPQTGSPFAMKWGGVELNKSLEMFGKNFSANAQIFESIGSSIGLEAGFDRRLQGWIHQKTLLEHELTQSEKNLIASEIRKSILVDSHDLHLKTIEQHQEIMEYMGDRFTNLGLYTWLSSSMQQVYKMALNNALSLARLAEQAFKFEREDTQIYIEGNYFDSSKAGLLAGEKLMLALQTMERKYIETNYRKHEIDQTFSLTQLNPAALLNLKNIGSCNFEIPELYYDLFYPGQFKRKIQSVKLTIPCITGPYTNISATLSLTTSKIRTETKLGNTELKDVPTTRTTIIATSNAQNDAGVFQINFRDDRYMPFEGAGVISNWKLSLPKVFRQFDYQSINDVMIHISYTAEYDELFRDKIESQNNALEGSLLNVLTYQSLSRLISLRQEFSTDFHRLTHQPIANPILLKIQSKHFPLYLNGKVLRINKAKLILVTDQTQTVGGFGLKLNSQDQTGFTKDDTLGNLYSKDVTAAFSTGILKEHTIEIMNAADLAPTTPTVGIPAAIDTDKLFDIVLYLEYGI